jgi:hypothetical protein
MGNAKALNKPGVVAILQANANRKLIQAATDGNEKLVREALDEESAELEATNPGYHHSTALHMAAHQGHDEIVKFLLERGANPRTKTSNGYTPRTLAKTLNRPGVFALFSDDTAKQIAVNNPTVVEIRKARKERKKAIRERKNAEMKAYWESPAGKQEKARLAAEAERNKQKEIVRAACLAQHQQSHALIQSGLVFASQQEARRQASNRAEIDKMLQRSQAQITQNLAAQSQQLERNQQKHNDLCNRIKANGQAFINVCKQNPNVAAIAAGVVSSGSNSRSHNSSKAGCYVAHNGINSNGSRTCGLFCPTTSGKWIGGSTLVHTVPCSPSFKKY